jgi:type II secretory ATPase GspE/PulE/Tfp pilus assembly ATPase PilB-like protein
MKGLDPVDPLVRPRSVEEELARGADLSIISVVNALIEGAHALRGSDIHIDPGQNEVRVRVRVDGVLQDVCTYPKDMHSEVVSRMKVMAELRTDEHQAPQDGRFRHTLSDGRGFADIRVSIAPTYHGENVVLRLLTDNAENFTLEMLGFSKEDADKLRVALKKSNGMILSTGPTGSGKTTTLYTLIKMLNCPEVSIITIEDPIEYSVSDIEQIQVNPRVGLTFANGLRSILRQDPDVIMVGEIRDAETAGIAVNTALTGHLLLSTLHTSDAATTLPRLLDMGIDAYLVATTINVAVGQRLVRRICVHCKASRPLTAAEAESLSRSGLPNAFTEGETICKGEGCDECAGTGYRGRISVNEVLVADQEVREAILRKASASEIKQIAVKNGMVTMLEDGFKKVRAGETTIEEVLRVIHE